MSSPLGFPQVFVAGALHLLKDPGCILLIGIILVLLGARLVGALEVPRKKDLSPDTNYPHVTLYKYFCVFTTSLCMFLAFDFVVGSLILVSALVLTVLILGILGGLPEGRRCG